LISSANLTGPRRVNSFRRIFSLLSLSFRRLPVTTLLLLASAGLFAVRLTIPLFENSIDPRHYFPGALERLVVVEHPEISGYFQLWRGDWWRILVSGLHHGSLLHLVLNALLIWSCGAVLEPRFGRRRYAFFLTAALLISALPEIVIESNFIGLSGVGYALFGVLLILRRVDPQVAKFVSPQFVWMGFSWLFLCIPLTQLQVFAVANGAHLGGLLYGAFVGWQFFVVGQRRPWIAVLSLGLVHGLAVCWVSYAVTPFRNGAYFAWKATDTRDFGNVVYWQRATDLDPHQVWAWQHQIAIAVAEQDWAKAWGLCLNAAKANRSEETFIDIARQLWAELEKALLISTAQQMLDQTFGPEAVAWKQRIFGGTANRFSRESQNGVPVPIDDIVPEPTLSIEVSIDDDLPDFRHSGQLDLLKTSVDENNARLGESS